MCNNIRKDALDVFYAMPMRKTSTLFALMLLVGMFCSKQSVACPVIVCDSLMPPMMAKLDSTAHFYFYHPGTCHLDLITGVRPDTLDKTILFCAEAAFTGKIVDSFYYKNIAGDFVTQGEYHRGYECGANSGGFVYYKDGHWNFFEKSVYQSKLRDTTIQCAYEQAMLIHEGVVHRPYLMKPSRQEIYRALCETQNGDLMVVTAKADMPYDLFVQGLIRELQVRNALYMDMGKGWNYSWYRNEDGSCTTLFPIQKWTAYQTNWLVVKRGREDER